MTNPDAVSPRPPLRRASGTPVAGVCAGLARHLGVSVQLMRVLAVLLTLAAGIGVLLYLWLWIFVPSAAEPTGEAGTRGLSGPAVDPPAADDDVPPGAARDRLRGMIDRITGSSEVLMGSLLLAASILLLLQLLGVPVDWQLIAPPVVLVVGVLLAWSQLDRSSAGQEPTSAFWQVAGGASLVMVALLVIASGMTSGGDLIVGVVLAAMLLAGLALVIAPWLIRLYRTSNNERARAAAEAERADIAAHLHDSVLQTLAMIQKQKSDPAAVEQLARGQERQLRAWLYKQHAAATGSLKDQMLAVAAELEETHSIPVEAVAVGESSRTDHTVLVAAAREAILNALKHAGPASVYVESNAREDAVFIRDRGDGFEVDGIAEDRLGVRESIIGRMRRAGGEARIRSGPRGTEVQLFMPVAAGAENGNGSHGGLTGPQPTVQTAEQPETAEQPDRAGQTRHHRQETRA